MIHITYPYIPISINRAYNVNKFGTFYQSKAVKVYKEEFINYAKENWLDLINQQKIDDYDIFHMTVNFFFPKDELINEKYGKDGRIKSPYKRLDIDNRIKLLQDCVSSVFGIDDTKIFSSSTAKYISDERRVEIYMERVNLENYRDGTG